MIELVNGFAGDKLVSVKALISAYATLKVSKKQFYKIMQEHPDEYIKNQSAINAAENLRSKNVCERNLEVLYITGSSGSGKTTLAKYLSDKKGYDYFVSGGGDDILDSYDKEECIILDDFRGGTMRFSEFLKMLDNNTNSTISSRYYNKDISSCRLIIIKSVNAPNELYSMFKEEGKEEPIEQLLRRIRHRFLKINEEGKVLEFKIEANKEPVYSGYVWAHMSEVYKILGIKINKEESPSIFDEMRKKEVVLIESQDSFIDDIF